MSLPAANRETLAAYLRSAARTIEGELGGGLEEANASRLSEASAIIARVAQQVVDSEQESSAEAEYRALVAAEREFGAMLAPRTETPGARHIDAADVETYLKGHARGGPGTEVTGAKLLAGGRCKVTALIEQEGAADLPSSLVLRQDWEGGATETSVVGEFALLELLHEEGVRVPRPLVLERSDALGLPFILVERIEGAVNGGLYEPPSSPALMRQLAEQLGKIHAVPLERAKRLFTEQSASAAGDPAAVDAFEHNHRTIGLRSKIVDAAIAWLRANSHLTGDQETLVHNDFGFHNVLTQGDRLTAVLDWELAKIGHPASDLGYVMHFVTKVVGWDEFLAWYREAGGSLIAPDVVHYHAVWNAVRLYGLIMQARHNLEIGRVDDIEISYACADNVMRLIAFLGELVLDADRVAAGSSASSVGFR
ncbi:hypothetical protein GCM10011371_00330 [Novosphingobium marinum]|uniref:Aminoglycoside phosphotransferase (APT) family kinase protein n=1 Tax=Novosphingobium marinum TaxID=1514948 RepID=A0A7Z0BTX7_9SPHN|nr:phosphotransferase family protein [Novosphingobium marinum]NYH93725.1 aminoglycoside phosphotransferase (APT) family kinase protein [Novosphingobium marinum]GGC16835.1 hypothetical protein GCM10011371_00330 [Novosphingobium marinum]